MEADPVARGPVGQFDPFAPAEENATYPIFVNSRTRYDDHPSREGNWFESYRTLWGKKWEMGKYAYNDRRLEALNSFFNQLTPMPPVLPTGSGLRATGIVLRAAIKRSSL